MGMTLHWVGLEVATGHDDAGRVLLQIVLVVDVEGAFDVQELTSVIPDKRDDRLVLSLVEHGAPRVERFGAEAQPIDWLGIGRAVEAVARRVRDAAAGHELHLYVGGQGPLPIFAHLGYAISKFMGRQYIIARKHDGGWELLPLVHDGDGSQVLTAVALPLRESHSTGQVAVCFDTGGRAPVAEALRAAVDVTGDSLADVVELRSAAPITVTSESAGPLAMELVSVMGRIPSLFPHAAGLGLFIAGPTFLGFAVGRAMNPTIVRSARLYHFAAGKYEPVYELPFIDDVRPALPMDPEAIALRAAVQDTLLQAIEELKTEVADEDLVSPLVETERGSFLRNLKGLRFEASDDDEFFVSVAGGTFSLGAGLLEALRGAEKAMQQRFLKLLMLHELFHEHQNVRSTNYFEVGRAGVVLEAVDYVADVFAVRVMTRSAFRRTMAASDEAVRAIAVQWLDTVVFGIQAFDQLQQGARINHLADRRLRRYLAWHLQRVRCEFVDSREHVDKVLGDHVTAEIAPLNARVDRRFDRVVVGPTVATEFFAAIGGRLVRHAKRPGFDPAELVEAVRCFNQATIQRSMRFVVGENKPVLIPWRH